MPRSISRRAITALLVCLATVGSAAVATLAAPAGASSVIDGPDVSSYQHPAGAHINWSKVKSSGREFAIVKATEGTYYVNPWFRTDYWRVHLVGMVRGSYHFARPAYPLVKTATAQANFYVSQLGTTPGTHKTLPPALDLEVTGGLSRGALVTWAQTFLLTVRQLTGRTPMLYTYPSFWSSALGDPVAFQRFPLWMASYGAPVDGSASLWQYTSSARVSGIRGRVDMSKLKSATPWSTLSDGRVATPWDPAAPTAPHNIWGTPADGSVTLHWLPGDAGTSPVQRYRVTAWPIGTSVVVGRARTNATVTGLTNGMPYTFTVTAVNAVGPSPSSPQSTPVVPKIPTQVVIDAPQQLVYPAGTWVHALLRRPDTGAPLATQQLTVQVRRHGTLAWQTQTMTTDDNGRIAFWLKPTTNLDVRVSYAAPFGWASSVSTRTITVRSSVGAHLSRTYVHVRHAVNMHGYIGPAVGGVQVWQQRWSGGSWHTIAATVTTEAGFYRFTWTPTSVGTRRYRAVVAAYGGRSRGYSAAVTLRIVR